MAQEINAALVALWNNRHKSAAIDALMKLHREFSKSTHCFLEEEKKKKVYLYSNLLGIIHFPPHMKSYILKFCISFGIKLWHYVTKIKSWNVIILILHYFYWNPNFRTLKNLSVFVNWTNWKTKMPQIKTWSLSERVRTALWTKQFLVPNYVTLNKHQIGQKK